MTKHYEKRVLPYTKEQLFDLVADIDAYQDFLPWCLASRITKPGETKVEAELVIGFSMFRERFVSRVTLERPYRIHVEYLEGPMKYLSNEWVFRDHTKKGHCEIEFYVEFEFRNPMLQKLVGAFFSEAFRRMVAAFEKRASDIYGPATTLPRGRRV